MEINGIKTCPDCRGFGKINKVPCKTCSGKGWNRIGVHKVK